MIELETDGISLVYGNKESNKRRNIRIDKISGTVKIADFNMSTGKLVKEIRCNVYDLDSSKNINKYAEKIAENIIDSL